MKSFCHYDECTLAASPWAIITSLLMNFGNKQVGQEWKFLQEMHGFLLYSTLWFYSILEKSIL